MDEYAKSYGHEPTENWILVVHVDNSSEFYSFDDSAGMWCCAEQGNIRSVLSKEIRHVATGRSYAIELVGEGLSTRKGVISMAVDPVSLNVDLVVRGGAVGAEQMESLIDAALAKARSKILADIQSEVSGYMSDEPLSPDTDHVHA